MADGAYRKSTSHQKLEDPRLKKSALKDNVLPKKIIVNKVFFSKNWPETNSVMYNQSNQYTSQGYQSSYPQYQQSYNSGYGYESYGQSQYINQTVQPIPPGEEYPQNSWAPVSGYNQHHTTVTPAKNEDDGVAQERKQQHAQLVKQREEYVRKAMVLRRELELLRNQKQEILSENSSQRDMEPILKENDKLQEEIQSKMKAIYNVIEMLSSIIKDGQKVSDLEAQLSESPKLNKNHKSGEANEINQTRYNYMHYDPELHWCRMCDEFPKTAKDLLLHLQSEKHRKNISENDVGDNTPWHKLPPEPELPVYDNAPKKRIPIRGLQFFIAAPAWYCKLCDTWIGDLHCASHHLKSQAHFQNYANFVEQNPHWEIEWLKDREKAMARSERRHSSDSDSDKKKKKHKNKRNFESSSKDKKKKKRSKKRRKRSSDSSSSSSSSDSSSDEEENNDKSKSIRVVMRNMKVQSIMNEDLSGKWEMLERLVDEHKKKEVIQKKEANEDKLINQWMTVSQPQEKEKVLLDNLKDRMKQKQELEKAKQAEMEKKRREKERIEKETLERKQREEQEARERYEKEKKEREREEFERIRDKERESVRFKTTRDRESYSRRRESIHESPDRERSRERERRESIYRERRESTPRSEKSKENGQEKTRSKSPEKDEKKKPQAKRLPFIGRMPLFKNKKVEEKYEVKEIKKEDYDIPRQTRFQPGNLAKAFLPQPDVVCYPKLSCIPPLTTPPPPPKVSQPDPPAPPKISNEKLLKAPPAPKICLNDNNKNNEFKEDNTNVVVDTIDYNDHNNQMMDQNMINSYYQSMEYNMMYGPIYDYSQCSEDNQIQPPPPPPPPPEDVPLAHTMPLQPPPLPPNDPSEELAMLGITPDDMAAQTF